jgi:diguanylate cyclase (GGDEF)-like protein
VSPAAGQGVEPALDVATAGPIQSMLLGWMLALAVVGGVLSFPTRMGFFALYGLYCLSWAMYWWANLDGTIQLLPPWVDPEGLLQLSIGTRLVSGVLVANAFLRTSQRRRLLGFLVYASVAVVALTVPLAPLLGAPLTQVVIDLESLAVPLLVFGMAVEGVHAGQRSARLFLAAWGTLLLGLIPYLASRVQGGAEPAFAPELLQLVTAAELLVLGFALADRIRELVEERDHAQATAVENLELRLEEAQRSRNLERERAEALAIAARERSRAMTDALTGLQNKAAFISRLQELKLSPELDQVLIGIVDVDNLKVVNDERGHAAGDQMLKDFARAMQDDLRRSDETYRVGGDEFAILAPGASDGSRGVLRKRLLQVVEKVRECGFPEADLSMGFASLSEAGTVDQAQELADQRMYEEKRSKAPDDETGVIRRLRRV